MSPATANRRAAPPDLVNRRLATGLLLSILVHAMLLLLQFGVPGLGLPAPSAPQPVSVKLASAEPALPPVAAPSLDALPPLPPLPLPPLPVPPAGMRVIAPASEAPKAPVSQAIKPKRSTPRRIRRPLPPSDLVETPTQVIAQDNKLSDFALPMAQPEEAQQQRTDPKAAQDGTDDGVDKQAALLAETARKEDEERVALLAAEAKAQQERLLARQAQELKLEQQRRADELAARRQADERDSRQAALRQQQADERTAQEQLRRQQADQLAARQQADELALRQRAQERAALLQTEALAARQRTKELARQNAEQAEQLVRRQTEQAARQQAEQVAKQLADEAARRQSEQLARQRAEQAAAAGERERALAAAQRDAGTTGAGPGGAGAGGGGSTAPKNLLGSDIGNRVRELTGGIDLLKGAPPPRVRDDPERGGRRLVSGAAEQDVPVRMYVDSFRQKVERNGGLAFAPRAADAVRIEPLVSVALRSDGSVEEVTIVRSSGHAETDNAVRRIIRLNARYSAFPPNIANRYDVIEIRRIWSFAESLRLLEELR
ncbi:TonB C-terminal domain-containing protein [Massilia sp. TWR1-2-2]|uniref:TonB C-terminal domain-containing protein n=1 Tax=Massilia sp. TWR1-2-2 TaxID=2804584 RepID=UPI003CF05BB8